MISPVYKNPPALILKAGGFFFSISLKKQLFFDFNDLTAEKYT